MKVACSARGVLCCCLMMMPISAAAAEPADVTITRGTTSGGVEYGLWGQVATKPAPLLIILSGTIDGTLGSAYFRQCGNELAEQGYLCASIDIPCHGEQVREGEPSGLKGWSYRAARDEDFVAECNARLTALLDDLIHSGLADPARVAICGTSRGGFLALQFAAHDSRVRCAAAFGPVTKLAALSEFQGQEQLPLVQRLALSQQAEQLAGRPVWIVIGDQDQRVGTQHAVDFAAQLTATAKRMGLPDRAELHVLPEPRGHTTPAGSSRLAADWIARQMAQ